MVTITCGFEITSAHFRHRKKMTIKPFVKQQHHKLQDIHTHLKTKPQNSAIRTSGSPEILGSFKHCLHALIQGTPSLCKGGKGSLLCRSTTKKSDPERDFGAEFRILHFDFD